MSMNLMAELPFSNCGTDVPDFIECKPDIAKTEKLQPLNVNVTDDFVFIDRALPSASYEFVENTVFTKEYFVELHNRVKSFGVCNYRGARIPLEHNNINVDSLRALLIKHRYPHIHIMQYVEYGFPLGLWTDAFLEPSTKNHSSAYSYFSYIERSLS